MISFVYYNAKREMIKERLNDPDGFFLTLKTKKAEINEVSLISIDETSLIYENEGKSHRVCFDDIEEVSIIDF